MGIRYGYCALILGVGMRCRCWVWVLDWVLAMGVYYGFDWLQL